MIQVSLRSLNHETNLKSIGPDPNPSRNDHSSAGPIAVLTGDRPCAHYLNGHTATHGPSTHKPYLPNTLPVTEAQSKNPSPVITNIEKLKSMELP